MFQPFFVCLRKTGVPVSLGEYLAFLGALKTGLVTHDVTGFYHLARLALVKDERFFDRFDRAFTQSFQGLDTGIRVVFRFAGSLPDFSTDDTGFRCAVSP